jgi:PqqD family protein of HPr-rel-A system
MTQSPDPIWRVDRPEELLWETWDDGIVLFQPTSGKTHVLNPLGALALDLLAESPCTSTELVDRIAQATEQPHDEALRGQIDSLLSYLEHLGISRQDGAR